MGSSISLSLTLAATTSQSASPTTYLTPTSIVTADFNGDGIPDLAAVNYGSTLMTILLGNGDGTFKPTTVSPHAGSNSQFLATADLNGDGVADLVVANTLANSVSILIGNGDGTFTVSASTLATGAYPDGIAIADLNGDGIPDLAVANSGSSNSISTFLGNGDGTFHQSLTTSVGSNPTSIAVADFNGDGVVDLAVADQGANSLTVLLGKGDGTFTTATPAFPSGTQPIVVVAGDFNGDGVADLATANNGDNTVSTFTVFGHSASASTSGIPVQVSEAVQVVAKYSGDTNYSASSASITLTSKSTPTVSITSSSTSFTYGTSIMLSSSVTGVGAPPSGQISFYAGTFLVGTAGLTNGTAVLTTSLIPGGSPSMTAKYSGDPNYSPFTSSAVIIKVAKATPSVSISSSSNPVNAPATVTFTAAVGGEGSAPTGSVIFYDDLNTPWGYSLGTVILNSSGTATISNLFTGGGDEISAVYSGDTDYLPGNEADLGEVAIAATYTTIVNVSYPPSAMLGQEIDFLVDTGFADGGPDDGLSFTVNVCEPIGNLCTGGGSVMTQGESTLAIYPSLGYHKYVAMTEAGYFWTASQSDGPPIPVTVFSPLSATTLTNSGASGGYTLSAGVNGNAGSSPTGQVSILDAGNANAVLASMSVTGGLNGLAVGSSSTIPTANGPTALTGGDFNNDGILDLAVVNQGSKVLSILLGNGDGTFQPTNTTPSTGSDPVSIAAADFNGDGKLDLAVIDSASNSVTILLGAGSGKFSQAAEVSSLDNGATSLTIADFNGDGKPDLAVSYAGESTVTILLGNGDGSFTLAASPATGSSGSSFITHGDFNGDGKPDLALANSATNSISLLLGNGDGTFSLSNLSLSLNQKPTFIAVADLNDDGNPDLIVTTAGAAGTVGVFLNQGNAIFSAGAAISATFNQPTSIGVADLNLDGNPDIVILESGSNSASILLGSSSGVYTKQASSFTTGSGSAQMLVADFNGDGVADLAVSNSNSNNVFALLIDNISSSAVFTNFTLPAGTGSHQVFASYSGDGIYSASKSAPITLIAGLADPQVILSASENPSSVGLPVTISATIKGSASIPTGSATFFDGSTPLLTTQLNPSGIAAFTSSALAIGQHSLTASYTGNNAYNQATSQALQLVVEPLAPTITFSVSGKTYGMTPFGVEATSTSEGKFSYSIVSGPATLSGSQITITGIGSVVVLASQAASGNYSAGSQSATFSVAPATPTITLGVPNQIYGASPFIVSATSNSSGALTYSIVSGPASIKGSTVSLTAIGTVTIKVSQAAAGDYTSGTQMATFKVAAAIPQIDFSVSNQTYGTTPFKVTATSDSTGIFTYSVVSGSAQITGSTVTLTGKGTVVLKATQAASGNYQAGSQTVSFSVIPEAPEISFSVLNHAYGSAPFSVAAASNSSSAFTYSVVSGAASISDSTVTLKGVGSVVLKASQAAAGNYSAGSQTATFVVSAGVPTIKFAVAGKSYGVAPFTIAATSNSTGAIAYSHVSGPATVSGTTVTLTGVGTVVLKASQTAAGDYTAGSETASFAVTKGTQTIKFPTLPTAVIYGASGISLAATASSGLPVTYSVTGPATISASTLTINGAGSVKVTASQAGNSDYGAAPPVTKTIIVSRAVLTVTADNATRVYGAANPAFHFTLTGFVDADTAAKATTGSPLLTTTAAVKSAVGSYAITAAVGTLTATNYTFKYIAGVLSVTHAPLKVVVASATKVYGAAEPVFSGVVTGLLNGDVVTAKYSSTGLTSSAVGSYPITAALSGSALTNYTPTIVPATLTIGRAVLTVKANSVTRAYDTANPVFTDVITGFVNGDKSTAVTGSAALTTTATLTSPVGTYPISAATGSLAAKNYTFTFVKGTLTITATSASLLVFSPDGRTYATKQTVEITDATASTSIQYTTNGTKPTTSSSRYSFAITVAATETLEAIAIAAYPAKAKNQKAG